MSFVKEQKILINIKIGIIKKELNRLVKGGQISLSEKSKILELVRFIRSMSEQLGYYYCCGHIHSGWTCQEIV